MKWRIILIPDLLSEFGHRVHLLLWWWNFKSRSLMLVFTSNWLKFADKLSNGMLVTWALFSGEQTAKRQCFQRCLHPSAPKKVDQAAKDIMSRALQGSCDLGPVVEVWFSLVLKYLWHCLPSSGSKVSTLEQALIRTVRVWQGRERNDSLSVCFSVDL